MFHQIKFIPIRGIGFIMTYNLKENLIDIITGSGSSYDMVAKSIIQVERLLKRFM